MRVCTVIAPNEVYFIRSCNAHSVMLHRAPSITNQSCDSESRQCLPICALNLPSDLPLSPWGKGSTLMTTFFHVVHGIVIHVPAGHRVLYYGIASGVVIVCCKFRLRASLHQAARKNSTVNKHFNILTHVDIFCLLNSVVELFCSLELSLS